mmetsp:Transcript_85561/g.173588  ORF Transcript_85561/g.173588 Transcript_85561/m.173588 type:complete len:298 (-) Transcript_85561:216-1109(-)
MDPFENQTKSWNRFSSFRRAVRKITPKRGESIDSLNNTLFFNFVWIVSGVVSVLIPLIYRIIHMKRYREEYMKYYWQQEYEEYAEERKENYEKYGNSYNNGGYGEEYQQNGEYEDVNKCRWWDFNCFSFFVNKDGEPQEDQEWAPAWYSGFIVTEQQRQEMEDNLEQPGSLKFVYVWQMMMFLVILWYGSVVIRQQRNITGLIIALLVWSNFAFLSMWLMADGSIVSDGQSVKRTGFYGQMSVLIFMTNFWYFLHGLFFLVLFWLRSSCLEDQKQREAEEKQTQSSQVNSTYSAPQE